MLETLGRQAEVVGRSVINSVEQNPWVFVALVVVTLIILIRRSGSV